MGRNEKFENGRPVGPLYDPRRFGDVERRQIGVSFAAITERRLPAPGTRVHGTRGRFGFAPQVTLPPPRARADSDDGHEKLLTDSAAERPARPCAGRARGSAAGYCYYYVYSLFDRWPLVEAVTSPNGSPPPHNTAVIVVRLGACATHIECLRSSGPVFLIPRTRARVQRSD